jgi:hypothetical protein
VVLALIILSLATATFHPTLHGENESLTSTLAAVSDTRIPLEVLHAHNVRWVIVYSGFSRDLADQIHNLGMKCITYVSALKEPASAASGIFNGYTTILPQENWAQYDPATGKYMYPNPSGTQELWFCPYGPYVQQVTIPRVRRCLEQGADGVFLDTLILYPNADDNPVYAHPVWTSRYSGYTYQQFRYRSLHDVAKQIYDALKAANPNAVLMISDNNVCVQSAENERVTRERYASAIDQWQDAADGFVLEYVDLVENNYASNPLEEAQAVINVWSRERTVYGVTKPIWLLAYTNRDDVFQLFKQKSMELGFGYWAYNLYFPSRTVAVEVRTSGLGSLPAAATFSRPSGDGQATIQLDNMNPNWRGYLAKGTTVSISSVLNAGSGERFITRDTTSWTVSSDQTFTVNYRHEYYLTVSVGVPGCGTVSPSSGWVEAGAIVVIEASPGTYFQSWTGIGSGSYTGTANPVYVAVNSPITQIANFQPTIDITVTSTISTTTRSTSTSQGSTSITTTLQSTTTRTTSLPTTTYQTTTTTLSSGSVSTTYTVKTTFSTTLTSFSTSTSTLTGTSSYVTTSIFPTQTTTSTTTSVSATTTTATGYTTVGQRINTTIVIQLIYIQQFLQQVMSTVLYWFNQITQIIQVVYPCQTALDTVVQVQPLTFTTSSTTITSTMTSSTTSTTYTTSTTIATPQSISTTASTTIKTSLATTTTQRSGTVAATSTFKTTLYSTSTSVSTVTASLSTSGYTTTHISKTGTSTQAETSTTTITSGTNVQETTVVRLTLVEQFIQTMSTLIVQGAEQITQIIQNVLVTETAKETVIKVEPPTQKASSTFSLDHRIVGSKGGTIKMTLQIQGDANIGAYEIKIMVPSEISVGDDAGTGFFANSKHESQATEHRWLNPSANGQSSGVLTIDLIIPSNLPNGARYLIVLQAAELKDSSGNWIGSTSTLPVTLTISSIHPVGIGTIYDASIRCWRREYWPAIDRVPTLIDVLDLIQIYLGHR